MRLHTSSKGGRKVMLTKTEVTKLKDAKLILDDLTQFTGIKSFDEALARIGSDGVVGDPAETPADTVPAA